MVLLRKRSPQEANWGCLAVVQVPSRWDEAVFLNALVDTRTRARM